jgi:two-component system response regulator DesR
MAATPLAIRVVVVDDNDGFRRALGALFESDGIEVAGEAADAETALATVLAQRPDVALVDLNLAGSSGPELIAELVRVAPETAVIVLSGSGETADVEAALAAGARQFLVKGTDPAEVCAAVREAVR